MTMNCLASRAVLLAGALLLASASPAEARSIRLADEVELSPASGATDAVREECGLQRRLPELVAEANPDVELVPRRHLRRGTVLRLTVVDVHAPGGGPFSGPKSMTVAAELRERGELVATARAKRVTTAAPFRGGTCRQLDKIARAIARDLGHWLRDPTRNARLGDDY